MSYRRSSQLYLNLTMCKPWYILAMIFIFTHFLFFLVGLEKVITRYYVPFTVTQSLMMVLAMSLSNSSLIF